MSAIKNVVIAGATGALGSVVARELIHSGLFSVTVFKRQGSKSVYPAGSLAKIVEVDYSSRESLQAALAGQDAVVSTLGAAGIENQIPLIDAAAAAGVKRFIPSEFGSKLDNPNTRKIPIFAGKVQVEEYIAEKAKSSGLTYTFVFAMAFLDWGLKNKMLIDLETETPQVVDGGDIEFSTTSLETIGKAVVGVLQHPEETKKRAVQVHDLVTTQNRLLDLARQAYPHKNWTPESVPLSEQIAAAEANIAKGIVDLATIGAFLNQALMHKDCGGVFDKTDNELLGIKPKGEDFIIETIKSILG